MQIIDAHTHCYPQSVYQGPRAWAEAHNERHWADLVAPTDKPSIQSWATPLEMLKAMDAAEVEKAVLLGWYWEHSVTCAWHNDEMAHWMREAPDRFIGFATLQPSDEPKLISTELNRVAELGFQGVGELHPGVQGFNSRSDGWLALASWCSDHGWPVNFHCTEAVGRGHAGNVPTPLDDFVRIAEQNPELKIILSHWGGGLPFFELNPHVKEVLKNVYYDCSASPLLYEASVFKRVIDLVGVDKLLFGSDFPLRVFPRKQKNADFNTYLTYIKEETGLNQTELEALLAKNFNRLMAH